MRLLRRARKLTRSVARGNGCFARRTRVCSTRRAGAWTIALVAALGCGHGPDPRVTPDASGAPPRDGAPGTSDGSARRDGAMPMPMPDAGPPPRWAPCGRAVRRFDIPLPPAQSGFAPTPWVAGAGDVVYAAAWDESDTDDLLLVVHVVELGAPGGTPLVTTRARVIGRVLGAELDGPLPHAIRAAPPAQVLLDDHHPEPFVEIVDLDDPMLSTVRHELPEGSSIGRGAPAGDGFAVFGATGPDVFEMSLVTSEGVAPLALGSIAESGGFFWGSGVAGIEAMWLSGRRLAHGDVESGRIVVRDLAVPPGGGDSVTPIVALADGGALAASSSTTSTRLTWLDARAETVAAIDVDIAGLVVDVAAAGDYPEQVVAILTGTPPSLFVGVASAPGEMSAPLSFVDAIDVGADAPGPWLSAFVGASGERRVAYAFGSLRVIELCGGPTP